MYIYILYTLNKHVLFGESRMVIPLQMKGTTQRWQRNREQPQYRNSASCSELEKNITDVLHRSREMGDLKPFIHSEAAS